MLLEEKKEGELNTQREEIEEHPFEAILRIACTQAPQQQTQQQQAQQIPQQQEDRPANPEEIAQRQMAVTQMSIRPEDIAQIDRTAQTQMNATSQEIKNRILQQFNVLNPVKQAAVRAEFGDPVFAHFRDVARQAFIRQISAQSPVPNQSAQSVSPPSFVPAPLQSSAAPYRKAFQGEQNDIQQSPPAPLRLELNLFGRDIIAGLPPVERPVYVERPGMIGRTAKRSPLSPSFAQPRWPCIDDFFPSQPRQGGHGRGIDMEKQYHDLNSFLPGLLSSPRPTPSGARLDPQVPSDRMELNKADDMAPGDIQNASSYDDPALRSNAEPQPSSADSRGEEENRKIDKEGVWSSSSSHPLRLKPQEDNSLNSDEEQGIQEDLLNKGRAKNAQCSQAAQLLARLTTTETRAQLPTRVEITKLMTETARPVTVSMPAPSPLWLDEEYPSPRSNGAPSPESPLPESMEIDFTTRFARQPFPQLPESPSPKSMETDFTTRFARQPSPQAPERIDISSLVDRTFTFAPSASDFRNPLASQTPDYTDFPPSKVKSVEQLLSLGNTGLPIAVPYKNIFNSLEESQRKKAPSFNGPVSLRMETALARSSTQHQQGVKNAQQSNGISRQPKTPSTQTPQQPQAPQQMQGISESDAMRIFLQRAIATRRLHRGPVQDSGLNPLSDEEKAYLRSAAFLSRTRVFMDTFKTCRNNATAQVAAPKHAQFPQRAVRKAQRHQERMINGQLQKPYRERNASEPPSDGINPMDQPGAPKRERTSSPERQSRRYDRRYSLSDFSSAQFEDFVYGQAVPSIPDAYPSQHPEPESNQERESSAMKRNHVAPWLTSNVEDEDEDEDEEYWPPPAKRMRPDQEASTSQMTNYEGNVMHLQHVRNLQSAQQEQPSLSSILQGPYAHTTQERQHVSPSSKPVFASFNHLDAPAGNSPQTLPPLMQYLPTTNPFPSHQPLVYSHQPMAYPHHQPIQPPHTSGMMPVVRLSGKIDISQVGLCKPPGILGGPPVQLVEQTFLNMYDCAPAPLNVCEKQTDDLFDPVIAGARNEAESSKLGGYFDAGDDNEVDAHDYAGSDDMVMEPVGYNESQSESQDTHSNSEETELTRVFLASPEETQSEDGSFMTDSTGCNMSDSEDDQDAQSYREEADLSRVLLQSNEESDPEDSIYMGGSEDSASGDESIPEDNQDAQSNHEEAELIRVLWESDEESDPEDGSYMSDSEDSASGDESNSEHNDSEDSNSEDKHSDDESDDEAPDGGAPTGGNPDDNDPDSGSDSDNDDVQSNASTATLQHETPEFPEIPDDDNVEGIEDILDEVEDGEIEKGECLDDGDVSLSSSEEPSMFDEGGEEPAYVHRGMYNGDEEVGGYSRYAFLLNADRPASPTHSQDGNGHVTPASAVSQFDEDEDVCSNLELEMEVDLPAFSDHQHNQGVEEEYNTEASTPTPPSKSESHTDTAGSISLEDMSRMADRKNQREREMASQALTDFEKLRKTVGISEDDVGYHYQIIEDLRTNCYRGPWSGSAKALEWADRVQAVAAPDSHTDGNGDGDGVEALSTLSESVAGHEDWRSDVAVCGVESRWDLRHEQADGVAPSPKPQFPPRIGNGLVLSAPFLLPTHQVSYEQSSSKTQAHGAAPANDSYITKSVSATATSSQHNRVLQDYNMHLEQRNKERVAIMNVRQEEEKKNSVPKSAPDGQAGPVAQTASSPRIPSSLVEVLLGIHPDQREVSSATTTSPQ